MGRQPGRFAPLDKNTWIEDPEPESCEEKRKKIVGYLKKRNDNRIIKKPEPLVRQSPSAGVAVFVYYHVLLGVI